MLKASKILIVLLISDNKLILLKLEILHLWDANVNTFLFYHFNIYKCHTSFNYLNAMLTYCHDS